MDNDTALRLIQGLQEDRRKQQEQNSQLRELLVKLLDHSNGPQPPTLSVPARPAPARLTTDGLLKTESGVVDVESFQTGSLFTNDDTISDDESESYHVTNPLQSEEYNEEGLKEHIKTHGWTGAGREVLVDITDPEKQKHYFSRPFSVFPQEINDSPDQSHQTHYEIFNVGADGAPMQILPAAGTPRTSRSMSIWNRIRKVNADSERAKAMGRITIVREPSPLLFAALHYTHHKHLDMDEVYSFLVDDDPALIRVPDPFADKEPHRRSFVVTFEYFTIMDEGCIPMQWQQADLDPGEIQRTHVPITRCSSVVALSFEGKPMGHVKNKQRRAKKRFGDVYDPFSPYRVLNVQCYPDNRASLDSHDSTKHYVNGVEAFLVTLCSEYKDAVKRLKVVYHKVSDLVQPPTDFVFSLTTRDKLLFEDSEFTYSRRYFWAYNTLAIMNEDIEDMLNAYREAFKESVWDGTDKIIWPGTAESTGSAKHANFRRKMEHLRKNIEEQIERLESVHGKNEERMKYIKNLHNNLFNGTSVLESRRSVENAMITVEQGRNIKLLTLITILFLPLTFVTSVYGMTNIPPEAHFYHFAWTTIAICLPTYVLVGSLNTKNGMEWWTRQVRRFTSSLSSIGATAAFLLGIFGIKPKWTHDYHRQQKIPKTNAPETREVTSKGIPSARRRHMSNDMMQHRDTFNGMPQLSPKPTVDVEKVETFQTRLDRTNSGLPATPGEQEPRTPVINEQFSFKPNRKLRVSDSNTGSPPPHRPSIGVVALPGQVLPQAHIEDEETRTARRRGTMMTIASESAIQENNEDAVSLGSSTSSKEKKPNSFLQKFLPGRRRRKDSDLA